MAEADDRIRLPELPVFKRYSLALRQEFAGGEEVLAMLDRTATKVQQILDSKKAAREREEMRQRQSLIETDEAADQALEELMSDSTPVPDLIRPSSGPTSRSKSPRKSRSERESDEVSKRKRKAKSTRPSIIFVPAGRRSSAKAKATSNKKKTAAKKTIKSRRQASKRPTNQTRRRGR